MLSKFLVYYLDCNNFWFDDSMMEIVCKLKELKTLNIGTFFVR